MSRFNKRQHINIHRTVFVLHGNRCNVSIIDWRHMDAAGIHNTRSKCNSLRRIMVSADNEYLKLSFGQLNEKVVKQLNCLRRGNRFVVDISGNDHTIRLFSINDIDDFFEYVFLIFKH